MNWSAASTATLTQRWREGASSGDIARELSHEFGEPISRAAVARKRDRIGLPPRTGAALDTSQRFRGLVCGTGLRATHRSQPTPGQRPDRAGRMGPLPGSAPRLWTQRMAGECCFPVGGAMADTLSCCLPVSHPGAAYCQGHERLRTGHHADPD